MPCYAIEGVAEDPLKGNDRFDEDALLHRRMEAIETKDHGRLLARCVGDPQDPLSIA